MDCYWFLHNWQKLVAVLLVVQSFGSPSPTLFRHITNRQELTFRVQLAKSVTNSTVIFRNKRSLKKKSLKSLGALINSQSDSNAAAAALTAIVLFTVYTTAAIIIYCKKEGGPSKVWEKVKKCRRNKVQDLVTAIFKKTGKELAEQAVGSILDGDLNVAGGDGGEYDEGENIRGPDDAINREPGGEDTHSVYIDTEENGGEDVNRRDYGRENESKKEKRLYQKGKEREFVAEVETRL